MKTRNTDTSTTTDGSYHDQRDTLRMVRPRVRTQATLPAMRHSDARALECPCLPRAAERTALPRVRHAGLRCLLGEGSQTTAAEQEALGRPMTRNVSYIELSGNMGRFGEIALIDCHEHVWLVAPTLRWWDLASLLWWFFTPADNRAKVRLRLANGKSVHAIAVRVAMRHARVRVFGDTPCGTD